MAMRLCGTSTSYEKQYEDPVAANRIHTQTNKLERSALAYDNDGIAQVLHRLVVDGEGILKVLLLGDRLDAKLDQINPADLKGELITLSNDFLRIADRVDKILETSLGKERWPNKSVTIQGQVIYIPRELETLRKLSLIFLFHPIPGAQTP